MTTKLYKNGDKYTGNFKNKKMHGHGIYIFVNGNKYVGGFINGLRHGHGTLTSPDGCKYVGSFKNGKRHGKGTLTFPSGNEYIGQWKDGKRNGVGTTMQCYEAIISTSDIKLFEQNGHLLNVIRERNSIESIVNLKRKYTGEVKDRSAVFGDMNCNWGSINYEKNDFIFNGSGDHYYGQLKDFIPHGKGTWTSSDKLISYEGEFKDGFFDGKGEYVNNKTKEHYEGEWKIGGKHGYGRYKKGQYITVGDWNHDEPWDVKTTDNNSMFNFIP
jgi:hypothetical protein